MRVAGRDDVRLAVVGNLVRPKGVAVDSDGNVYVVDTGNNRIAFAPDDPSTGGAA